MSEHTETSTGRRSRRRDEARDLIKTLQKENPKADRVEIVKLYIINHVRPLCVADDDDVETLIINPMREWVGAQISMPKPKPATKTREERVAAKEANAAMVAEIATRDADRIEEIITRRLLEWEVIDGRRLGDLTGADCRNLSERCGVFLHVISDNIPARAKVRNHYTELELQALARHHKLIVP